MVRYILHEGGGMEFCFSHPNFTLGPYFPSLINHDGSGRSAITRSQAKALHSHRQRQSTATVALYEVPLFNWKMDIALDKAAILALFLETLLYGLYLVLFCLTLLVLLLRGESGKTQRHRLVPLSIVMMIFATTHLIIDFVRAIQAFVVQDGRQIDAIAYYSAVSHPLHLVRGVLYVTQTILGDSIIIWRCYVIFDQRSLVLIPNLIVLAVNSGVGYSVVWEMWRASSGTTIFQSGSPLIMTFFALTMCINITCTTAIAWRIYRTRSPLIKRTRLTPVLLAFVESGALYASSLLALMIAYASDSNGQYAVLDAVTPLVGITFCLIVLQIQFHLTSNVWNTNDPITINTISILRPTKQYEGEGREEHTIAYPIQPLAVHLGVEQGCEQDRSPDEDRRGRYEEPTTPCMMPIVVDVNSATVNSNTHHGGSSK
ncbi:hypothetical protein AB1N83_012662 [Pleurotus pulmonarius]